MEEEEQEVESGQTIPIGSFPFFQTITILRKKVELCVTFSWYFRPLSRVVIGLTKIWEYFGVNTKLHSVVTPDLCQVSHQGRLNQDQCMHGKCLTPCAIFMAP